LLAAKWAKARRSDYITGSIPDGRTVFSICTIHDGYKYQKCGFTALNWSRTQLWNRFTIRARHALQAAEREAKLRNYDQMDTEHILCGLLADSSGGAMLVLRNLGIQPGKIFLEVDKRLGWRPVTPGNGRPARTAAADRVLNFTLDAAVELRDDYIGTEHLLLGLFREKNGVAARVLVEMGLTEDSVRAEIVRAFPHGEDQTRTTPSHSAPAIGAFSDVEREFHLSIYRLAVDYYKPRIEKRTGVSLGDITVWEFANLPEHRMEEIGQQRSRCLPRALWRLLHRKRLRRYAEAFATFNVDTSRKHAACYFRHGIYVSFDSGVQHDEQVAFTVVHELSHALWETLSAASLSELLWNKPLSPEEEENLKLFGEGFAMYCEQIWFLDLYPAYLRDCVKNRIRDPDTIYARGLRQVERLVEQHGTQFLLEIPKRWRELDVG
jgi:hypothetical protein